MAELEKAKSSVMKKSKNHELGSQVKGYDFNEGIDYEGLLGSFSSMGIQATELAKGVDLVNKMLNWKENDPDQGNERGCKIFLGYTSNMVSSGCRELIKFLAEHKLVDVIVTTAGGIEEDFIKCLAPSHIGSFKVDDHQLREEGLNRIGNMLVPNQNYCLFEDWLNPLLDEIYEEQTRNNKIWSPSQIIDFLGNKIDHKDSIYYWCHKNEIPVFCPALTDGSMGDMIFFHSYRKPGLIIDIVEDIRRLNKSAMSAMKTGAVILGGGLVKHHIFNANLMRNGLDFTVLINTAIEYDASDAGATPQEAISWGKISGEGNFVKIFGEASIIFPLIISRSFAKFHHKSLKRVTP